MVRAAEAQALANLTDDQRDLLLDALGVLDKGLVEAPVELGHLPTPVRRRLTPG